METLEIMRNVNRLSLPQQMLIAERIIHSIRKREQPSLKTAAERLYADYMTDENLTAFTQLDCEDFYDARCIAAFPELKEIAESYSENLTIIGIYLDSDAGWKKALAAHDTPGISLRDPKAFGGLAANYGLKGIHYYVMISPEGNVVDIWGGYGKGSLKRKVSENVK
jgi:hypothetical protein